MQHHYSNARIKSYERINSGRNNYKLYFAELLKYHYNNLKISK